MRTHGIHPNRQDGNVGNRGDIRKHAALLEMVANLPTAVGVRPERGVLWLDTHAYRLHGSIPDHACWQRILDSLPDHDRDGYADYRRLQEETGIGRDGRYACSSAIAWSALRRLDCRHRAVLGEQDPGTRADLRQQVAEVGWSEAEVRADAVVVLASDADDVDLVIALVDPFILDGALWEQATAACERWREQGAMVAVCFYTHQHNADPYPWPMALGRDVCLGPVIDDGPHHLAWYGSGPPEIEATWVDMLAMVGLLPLGWRSPRYGVA